MPRLNRRDFLKALGLTGGATVAACGWDDNQYRSTIEQVLPYVVRAEQSVPGTPTFFATTVTTGPGAYPVLGNHREGRVVNVHANPEAVGAAGAHSFGPGVPKAALLELQRHFSPDRLRMPRSGTEDVPWDSAIQQLSDAVKTARAAGKTVAYLGRYRSGAMHQLLQDYTAGNTVYWEPAGPSAEALAWKKLTGMDGLPRYDVADARYVLSFGAEFLQWWGGCELEAQYATAKNPNNGGYIARFAAVTPRMSQTVANADDWYRAQPGSEAAVAWAVAKAVWVKKGKKNFGALSALLASVDEAAAVSASGLAASDIDGIASQFAEAEAAVAMPGGVAGSSEYAVDLAMAAYALNIVSGNSGKTFGVGYTAPIHGFDQVEKLIAQMNDGRVGVLLIGDVNPSYSLPQSAGVDAALAKVDMVVSLSGQPSETNANAKLMVPVADTFEDWGDEDLTSEIHILRQPVATALWQSRSLGDVLLATRGDITLTPFAAAAPVIEPSEEGEDASDTDDEAAAPAAAPFAPKNWLAYVQARWENLFHGPHGDGPFEAWWRDLLRTGVFISGDASLKAPVVALSDYAVQVPSASLNPSGYAVHVYPHAHRFDGRFANEPWAQEVPDPMTGQSWDSWVEVSPATAKALGVVDGDLLKVQSEHGAVEVGVEVTPAVLDNVLAIALGSGHTAGGTYANGTGVNAVRLLGTKKDRFGLFAYQQPHTVTATKTGTADLAPSFGVNGDSDGGRNIGVSVNAAALAKVGDKAVNHHADEHDGELTGIHHPPRDARLYDRGELQMYPLTDHPTYRFGMVVDTNACTGCGSCVIACYAENNLPVVGKPLVQKGRMMNWLRVNRFIEGTDENPDVRFVPMMCQHCSHAPCESVCPVLATYHTIDGLNAMVYNRCVGTRYCANNCPYLARRFNFHSYTWPEPFNLQLNPDVNTRTMGVMEKCTFCVQRLRRTKSAVKDVDGILGKARFTAVAGDGELEQLPACAEVCPSQAITFGNLRDPKSKVSQLGQSARAYQVLRELNAMPAISYLAKASFHAAEAGHHGGGDHGTGDHGGDHADGAGHHDDKGHEADHGDKSHGEPHGDKNETHHAPAAGGASH